MKNSTLPQAKYVGESDERNLKGVGGVACMTIMFLSLLEIKRSGL